ncbi:hypothetical protein SIDU_16445 [Sphingobium indicum B90A]|uniref:Uncharacterized protein n=2 Tax=Sphingobium indicum TaxID=332055 RepID=A0A1L5BSV2_SPHIB|nr:hypothetical protein SIDU_16445 [Sphingobium indicum B90A]
MDQSNYAWFTGKAKPKYLPADAPLSQEVIDRHLSGEQPIAAYVLSHPDENKGQVIVFDFDDHAGTFKSMDQLVAAFCAMLGKRKIPHTVVQSGGGHGYHVWLVFDSPKRKDVLRDSAKRLLASFEFQERTFTEGTDGVEKGQIEIFPKGDGSGGKNAIALPLARKSVLVRLKDSNGVLSLPHYGNDHQLPLIKKAAPGPKGKTAKSPDRDAAFVALVSNRDPANYDHWVYVAMRLIAAFGVDDPWAKAKWIEWSQTAPGADSEHEQEKKWQQCRNSRLSPATFWLEARDNGYSGDLPFSKPELDKYQVLDFAAAFPIYRSQDSETFACIGPRHFVPIKSREFKACIRRAALDAGRMLKAEDLNTVIETLDAQALVQPRTEFALRFAAHGRDKRFLFLGDEAATVIEIDAAGWRICEEPPVQFRQGLDRPLPLPVQGGTLADFRAFANVDDDNLPFLLAWMVHCLIRPGLACPIAILTGPAGSAKSSLLQIVVDLLDPKAGLRAGMPTKEDDLVVAAHQGAVVSFDNASTLAKLSDELCRLATGGGLRKRTLYTDKDVTAIDVIRPVIIAGIDPTAYQQDLIERLVMIELHRPERRIDDETLAAMVSEARPRLLGWLLDVVTAVLPEYEQIEVTDPRMRMVGFAKIGEVVARHLGRDEGWFAERYGDMLTACAEEAAGGDCVFDLLVMLVANEDRRFEISSAELLERLHVEIKTGTVIAAQADTPTSARGMSNRVRRIIEPLRHLKGIEISQNSHDRRWRMSPPRVATDEEVFASIQPTF